MKTEAIASIVGGRRASTCGRLPLRSHALTSFAIIVVAAACVSTLRGADKIDFQKQIQPILEKNCVKCHGPEKQKGKLRLDSKEAAMKGGNDGPAFVAGDASKSELHRRITLPPGDDDIMPNEGDPLTKEQIDLVREWINQGADWPETAAAKPAAAPTPESELPANFKPGAGEAKALAKFAQAGVDIRPIAVNLPWTQANFRLQTTNVTDAVIAPLKDVTSLTDLNLAHTKVTDAGLAAIAGLSNLTRLHLEQTSITDSGLAHLKGLTRLHYLNLYGTPVTDAGLEQLKALKRLKRLYLWQSKVTDAGVESLRKALPDLQISTGKEFNAVVKKEEKPEEKKEEEKK
ncbi:MAG TPA: c-type cytochrome domain-containing protein [Verrucomicrobiae bacterium]|nr:c-type cytochrome domain-containing protein [Verrucomicrobiae bacterium]